MTVRRGEGSESHVYCSSLKLLPDCSHQSRWVSSVLPLSWLHTTLPRLSPSQALSKCLWTMLQPHQLFFTSTGTVFFFFFFCIFWLFFLGENLKSSSLQAVKRAADTLPLQHSSNTLGTLKSISAMRIVQYAFHEQQRHNYS